MDKKKILIIEDELTLLAAMKSKLEMAGYNVICATDGEKGQQMIEGEKPDLVLLDILLPKRDGMQILEYLNEKNNKIPIIVVSNSGQPVEIDRVLKLGAKDYLVKADFSPSDVLEKVLSVVGPGSKVEMPTAEPLSQDSVQRPPNSSASKESVLIVEDDEFLREVLAQKLRGEGFDVWCSIDAIEALELMKEKKPKIILLDLILPGMDGFEMLGQLKKIPDLQDVPVIVLSNLGQKEDVDRALSAGAADYMIKANFTPADIVARIRKVISQKYI